MRFGFDDLVAVMAHLRGRDGCAWDREQTHASLAPYLLEEAHEALDAISRNDLETLRAELGDLLLQVVFHAQMAHEAGAFDADGVVEGLVRKLLDRHPHVFGNLRLGTAREVLAQWEELKRRESPGRPVFDGIPVTLPALARAQKLLRRAEAGGIGGARKLDPPAAAAAARRALDRTTARLPQDSRAGAEGTTRPDPVLSDALGALLLTVVGLAASAGIDAEAALRSACEKLIAESTSQV